MRRLSFHALVIEMTDRCNASCAMCYQASGPRGSSLRGNATLPLELALRVITEARQVPEIESRLHLSGGEAFLLYQDAKAIFKRARECGYASIGATTNGFWATTPSVAADRCAELAEAGVTYFEVSTDHWHLPFVPINRIRNMLAGSRRAGIKVMLRTLSTRNHHPGEVLADLQDADLMGVLVANCRLYPTGRAATEIADDEIYYGEGGEGNCEHLLTLTVAPNGNVYPCCAGADMTEAMSVGNIHRDTLAQALFKMRTDRLIQQVIHQGAGSLIPVVEELGYTGRLPTRYACTCHLCWCIFRDRELAGALRSHFEDQQLDEMIRYLQGLDAHQQDAVSPAP